MAPSLTVIKYKIHTSKNGSSWSFTLGCSDNTEAETARWHVCNVGKRITINNTGKYRYGRYVSPNEGFCNISEVEFYTTNDPVGLQLDMEQGGEQVLPFSSGMAFYQKRRFSIQLLKSRPL